MKKHALFFSTTLLIALATSQSGAAVRYNVTDLGTLTGYQTAWPLYINNNGQIVGEAFDAGRQRAVLFDTAGSGNNIDLGTLGGENSCAYSINDQGQIVGWADRADPDDGPRATLFDPNGTGINIDLETLGGLYSEATSTNNMGQIAGYACTSDGRSYCTLFDPNNPADNSSLAAVDGFVYAYASCINNQGTIVGAACNDPPSDDHAILFDNTGQGNHVQLGTLGGDTSAAKSVNNAGLIVGTSQNAVGQDRATLFDPAGTGNNVNLGAAEGYASSWALAITDSNLIIGRSENSWPDFCATLFDITGAGNNINLNELISPFLGWTLIDAISANNRGCIVGFGRNPQGYYRPFLLTPAAPGDSEPDRDVDLRDFAVFAAAWKSSRGNEDYNRFCDIAQPEDGVINERDLAVFAGSYLMDTP